MLHCCRLCAWRKSRLAATVTMRGFCVYVLPQPHTKVSTQNHASMSSVRSHAASEAELSGRRAPTACVVRQKSACARGFHGFRSFTGVNCPSAPRLRLPLLLRRHRSAHACPPARALPHRLAYPQRRARYLDAGVLRRLLQRPRLHADVFHRQCQQRWRRCRGGDCGGRV